MNIANQGDLATAVGGGDREEAASRLTSLPPICTFLVTQGDEDTRAC